MKHKSYKNIIIIFALCLLGTTFGQKFDKKFTENFKVNRDVEVAINASNTEINVTTWNKNEIQVLAFIEIEGLSKEEAEKYFENWNFEALGNNSKVKIIAKGTNSLGLKNDFVIFNNMNFTFPDIEMPNFDSIVIPDMSFDFDFDFDFDTESILEDLDDLDKNMGKSGKYTFDWNDGVDKITIKSKKEWEAFKKTKKYEELKEKMSVKKLKMEKSFAESKEQMKIGLAKAKLEYKKIDKEKIKKELQNAKEQIMKMKLNFNSNSDNITIDGKKVKIKKRLEIKVPENATFDLNTRHCRVKLPNTVAFGKVSYGTFDANNLTGGKLTIDSALVRINDLNACTLFLNNVTDAKIASVTKTSLSSNSSVLKINNIGNKVNLTNKFGELVISKFNTDFSDFNLSLSNSDAIIDNAVFIVNNLMIEVHANENNFFTKVDKGLKLNGKFTVKTKDERMNISGKFSSLIITKEF